eukprot:7958415-Pyramimonas_sp.AAC.1
MALKRASSNQSGPQPKKKPTSPEARLAAAVAKALYDNFRSWPEELVYVKIVDGRTLAERIRADKIAGTVTMGGPYYDRLRNLHRAETDVTRLLVPTDPTQAVQPELMRAMIKAKAARADRGPMQ